MSYFHTSDDGAQAQDQPREDREGRQGRERREHKRQSIAELGGRVARWFAGIDDDELDDQATAEHDPLAVLDPGFEDPRDSELLRNRYEAPDHGAPESQAPKAQVPEDQAPDQVSAYDEEPSRFPLAPFGYNRVAVDQHLGRLEDELEELRSREQPPMSISEELERIGEQTASILVVAHDTATETTRRAEEQAERCIADAATQALATTDEATMRLRELDEETDQVWRERARLLEDVRDVSASLVSLADQADARFPAESKGSQNGAQSQRT
jgi:hypothetical protein